MQPRWLSAQEQRTWRSFSDLSLVMEDALDQQLRHDSGMSHLNYSVLVILSELPEQRLRMTDLAEKLRIARTRLSYTIARMEEEGWVRREDSPGDKRVQLAVLTEAGVTALAEAAPGHVALVRTTLFDRLTPEQTRAFGEACAIVLAGMTGPERPALPVDLPWRR
ncbi:MarR family winged helix-turn-helix transcriptional regulator [Streptomyces acidiscabies]|uniref:MarR family transcriptional regulator n=1 Tax=Streptomyces acidiscabies TaxID=42234 RepID=A0A0L0JXG1_9ACTN|nr:MarR family transcriptional regulator [Streptomyces acidiscabies]KND30208.1 MarR family transcriptional regulator [Streptomyces acidiscabies]